MIALLSTFLAPPTLSLPNGEHDAYSLVLDIRDLLRSLFLR
jgi:hypothetical protein